MSTVQCSPIPDNHALVRVVQGDPRPGATDVRHRSGRFQMVASQPLGHRRHRDRRPRLPSVGEWLHRRPRAVRRQLLLRRRRRASARGPAGTEQGEREQCDGVVVRLRDDRRGRTGDDVDAATLVEELPQGCDSVVDRHPRSPPSAGPEDPAVRGWPDSRACTAQPGSLRGCEYPPWAAASTPAIRARPF
jgi:hypothetical protein